MLGCGVSYRHSFPDFVPMHASKCVPLPAGTLDETTEPAQAV
jgi:hypothetical protein